MVKSWSFQVFLLPQRGKGAAMGVETEVDLY